MIRERVNSCFVSTAAGKANLFFSEKARMRKCWSGLEQVAAVDGDMSDRAKLAAFGEFESSKSPVRAIMGTKLILNGLDCNAVNYVGCLTDCNVHVIDFLQMVGRIRGEGLLEVVRVVDRRPRAAERVAHSDLKPVNLGESLTQTAVSFYGMPDRSHQLCCGSWESKEGVADLLRLRETVHREAESCLSQQEVDDSIQPAVLSSKMFHLVLESINR